MRHQLRLYSRGTILDISANGGGVVTLTFVLLRQLMLDHLNFKDEGCIMLDLT